MLSRLNFYDAFRGDPETILSIFQNVEPQHRMKVKFVIDSMLEESSRIDFYRTQIVKYMWRLRDKGSPLKDAKKTEFYLGRQIEKLEQ